MSLSLMPRSSFTVKSSDLWMYIETPQRLQPPLAWWVVLELGNSNKDFSIVAKSSHYVSKRHITLKVKFIKLKNSLKFSKFFFMHIIFRCKTGNWSCESLRKLLNSPGIKYRVSRIWNFLLKNVISGLQVSSKRISVYCDILYFKILKFQCHTFP